MGLTNMFSKKVPDELPSLISEDLKKKNLSSQTQTQESILAQSPPSFNTSPQKEISKSQSQIKEIPLLEDSETGYFKDLIKQVTENGENSEKLDGWYKSKFVQGDIVSQMKEYWEKQQPEIIFRNLGGELKEKLLSKTEKLHSLEKEWQQLHFNMLSKEEEIRKEEKELKDTLSEFMSLCKRSSKKK